MRTIALIFLCFFSGCAKNHTDDIFEKYLWQKRVLVFFAPSLDHPLLKEQQKIIEANTDGTLERDLIVWTIVYGEHVIAEKKFQPHLPAQRFYRLFNVPDGDFSVILLGKDGEEKLRKTEQILAADDLFSVIDAMPMRRQEMKKK